MCSRYNQKIIDFCKVINIGFWIKMVTKEDPEFTFSHRNTESTATQGTISSGKNPEN